MGRLRVGLRLLAAAAVAVPIGLIGLHSVHAEAPDGSGTMTVSPTYTVNSATGKFFTFTYTAAAGGMTAGEIAMVVPAGWSAPVTDGFATGATNATCGDSPVTITGSGPWTVRVTNVTLSAGATCDIHYGINMFGTVNAPAATGTYSFTTQQKSTAGGTMTSIASSPTILVDTDGTGTMTVNPASALVSSSGNTHTFTYTATRTMSNGELTMQVPGNWSAPSTTGLSPGFTTSTCGAVSVVTNTIDVTGITLANGANCTITYGSTASGGPGATAPSTGGTQTFTVQHQSDMAHSNLQAIPVSPAISVVAPDGTGTMTVTPNTAITSSSGNFFTFTYTAANGGLTNGEISMVVPAGWSAPVTDGFATGATNATCGDSPVTITGSGPWTVRVTNVTLAGGATCDIHYGINMFGTVVAPSSAGNYVFTTQAKSVSTGVLTSLASHPAILVGDDGTGTMTVAPQSTLVSSTGNTLVFTYTAARTITAGALTMAVPAGWSAPSTTGSDAGFSTTTCSGGTVAAVGSSIQVTGFNLANGASCTITYGSTGSGGPGATAPATGGTNTFATQQKSSAGGTLTDLATGSPQVFVVAPDGTGTMTVTPNIAITSSTGNFFTFTYTAANGGMHNGELTLLVPAAWPAPDANGFNPGGTNALCGDSPVTITGSGPWTVHVTNVTLAGGATCDIHYGINMFGTVTAPSVAALYTFTAQQRSVNTGSLTALASSPQILVGTDGTGTMTVAPTSALAGSAGNTLVFTYTSATTMTNGEIDVAVPAGWPAPSMVGTDDGFTSSTCGAVGVAGQTIAVTGVNRTAGQTCTVTYGSTGSGGAGATAPAVGGTNTFTTEQKSSVGGTLTELLTSPQVFVVAADGSGTMTVSPTIVVPGSSGNALTFTYTAAAGSLHGGEITVEVPAGWTAPDPNGFNPGGSNAGCGDSPVTVTGSGPWVIHVTNVTLAGGATCDIRYGISGFGTVTAPGSAGIATFPVQAKSLAGGVLTSLASSPQVTIGTDGAGTLTVAPTTTSASSSGNTLTFTFTAPVGGLNAGEVDIAVPAGWSTPSTTGSAAGFTTTTCPGGSVAIAGGTIEVSGINLAAAATCTIVYGSTGSGGPGATAPAVAGVSTFAAQEKSTAGGTLTNLSSGSPQVTVFAADGSGTLAVSPTTADIGSGGNTLVFTYTAATGGTTSGQLAIAVPAGWTTPSTTGSNAGFTQSTCGSVAIVAGSIQVSGINLAGGATCTVTYGSTTSGGAGATAPAVAGVSSFAAQQKSTGGGSLTALASSPQVTVVAGTVMLDQAAVSVTEGANGASTSAGLHVVLGAVSAVDVTVHVAVTGGTATAGTDTSTLNQDITIPAGQTSAVVPFNVLGDDVVEGAETAQITLTVVSGATAVAPTVVTVTITNDDVATLTVTGSNVVNNAASIMEGGGGVSALTLTLDHTSASDITVTVATTDGTATAPGDYTPRNSQVFTILAGQSSLSIPLQANADGIDEPSETFTVRFLSASGAVLNAPDITITILDNDQPATTQPTTTQPPPTGTPLPATGGSPLGTIGAAILFVVIGGVLLAVRRRSTPA